MGWLAGWTRRKAIVLATPAELLPNFPFPAWISGDTDIGGNARSDGFDIRFTADDGTTLLNYERDVFSVTGGAATGLLRVAVPSWSALVPTTVYMYYGKADAPDVSNGPATFDANFVGVYHGGDGTTLSVADSSASANHGTNNGATAAAGQVGGAMEFVATDHVDLGAAASLDITGNFTLSAWINASDVVQGVIVGKHDANVSGYLLLVLNGKAQVVTNHTGVNVAESAATLSAGVWYHVCGLLRDGTLEVYINGTIDGSASGKQSPTSHATAAFLGELAGLYWDFAGLIDELRISNVARSAAWIAAEYGTIAAPATWQTWGAEESVATAKPWLYRRSSRIIGGGVL